MNYDTLLSGVKQAVLDSCRCLESGELAVSSKGPNDFLTSVDLAVSDALCRELPRLPGCIGRRPSGGEKPPPLFLAVDH